MKKINWTRYMYGLLIVVLTLPALSGCNEKDDVISIFTGKTWKLTYIAEKGKEQKMYDFWGSNETAYQNSMNFLKSDANFLVTFEGGEVNGTVIGTFTGNATTAGISGKWTADGENQTLTTSDIKTTGSDKDTFLGKAFIYGLSNAKKYKGDDNNLFIYYEEGQRTFVLFLHPLKE